MALRKPRGATGTPGGRPRVWAVLVAALPVLPAACDGNPAGDAGEDRVDVDATEDAGSADDGDADGGLPPALLFAGGFESGTLLLTDDPPGDWHLRTERNGTLAAASSDPHAGRTLLEATVARDTDPNHWGAFVRRQDLRPGSTAFARAYFKLRGGNNFRERDYRYFNIIWVGTNTMEEVCSLRIVHVGGRLHLTFCWFYEEGGAPAFESRETGFEVVEDVWYYIEIGVTQSDADGRFAAWAAENGAAPEQIVDLRGFDNDLGRPVECLCVGANLTANGAMGTLCVDDYALDDERVGP